MKDCETMVKILCHASLLKIDDVRIKRWPAAARLCTMCDHGFVDDVRHMAMECPGLQPRRNIMFGEIHLILEKYGLTHDVLNDTSWESPNLNTPMEAMGEIWICSARNISSMYRLKLREGIG